MTSISFPFTKHKPTISHISRCGCPVVASPFVGWDDPVWGDRQRARALKVQPVMQTLK